MSKTYKIQKAHHAYDELKIARREYGYDEFNHFKHKMRDVGVRYGNNRHDHAKTKVANRQRERRKLNNIELD